MIHLFPNKHKYSLLRATAFALSPVHTLISFFLKKNDNIIITAAHNREFSDNSAALFKMLYSEPNTQQRVFFVLNDEEKRSHYNKQFPGKFISNKRLKNTLFILKARYWFCSAMELPVSSIMQRHERTVIHLGHGMPYKNVGLLESNISWYKKFYYHIVTSSFSHSLATTSCFKSIIAQGFGVRDRVIYLPQPKSSQVFNPASVDDDILVSDTNTNILYAPTWRPYGPVKLFPFDDMDLSVLNQELADRRTYIWLRVHPKFEQSIPQNLLAQSHIKLFSGKHFPTINEYLAYFDVLITDYSSIFFDFLLLGRPVLFFDYDIKQYKEKIGLVTEYEKFKCTETTTSMQHFLTQIESIQNGGFNLSQVCEVNSMVNHPATIKRNQALVIEIFTRLTCR